MERRRSMNSFGAIGRLTPGMAYCGAGPGENRPNGMAFHGSNGTLIADRIGYEIIPEPPRTGAPSERAPGSEPPPLERTHRQAEDATALHARHFIRCLRDGEKPRADAVTGHRSSLVAHLGNIACRTGLKLEWDAGKEDFIGAPEASRLLGRRARKPWDMISG